MHCELNHATDFFYFFLFFKMENQICFCFVRTVCADFLGKEKFGIEIIASNPENIDPHSFINGYD